MMENSYADLGTAEGMLKNMHGLSDALEEIKRMRDSNVPDWKNEGFWKLFEIDSYYKI